MVDAWALNAWIGKWLSVRNGRNVARASTDGILRQPADTECEGPANSCMQQAALDSGAAVLSTDPASPVWGSRIAVSAPQLARCSWCSEVGCPRRQIANAVTAILLHTETVRRRSAGTRSAGSDLGPSLEHIDKNARAVWRALEKMEDIGFCCLGKR